MDIRKVIQECKHGSEAAQKYLFDLYADKMMVLCCRYVKNEADAEELLLNGFLNFFNHIREFNYKGEGSVSAWLRKIMINECLMFLRKKNVFGLTVETTEDTATIDEDIISRLSAEEIFKLITELPTGYRTVFNLFIIEGKSHREIAELLDISEGTSKSQLSKAKNMLQQMINKNNDYGKEHFNQ